MLKETIAIRTINAIIGAWEKQRVRLEVAIKVLQEKIKSNEILIKQKEENVKREIECINESNNTLQLNITEAENFKSNLDKILNK